MLIRRQVVALLVGLVLACGCAGRTGPAEIMIVREACPALPGPFPVRPRVCVHRVDASGGFGARSTLIGVTRIDPRMRKLHSILLSAEGFPLYEAEFEEGGFRVMRALPPFDGPAFTRGFAQDVGALFLRPPGKPSEAGITREGSGVCHWRTEGGCLVQLLEITNGWKLTRWDKSGHLSRTVFFKLPLVKGVPSYVELKIPGPVGYILRMMPIRVDP